MKLKNEENSVVSKVNGLAVAVKLTLIAVDEVSRNNLAPLWLINAVIVNTRVIDEELLALFSLRVRNRNSREQ